MVAALNADETALPRAEAEHYRGQKGDRHPDRDGRSAEHPGDGNDQCGADDADHRTTTARANNIFLQRRENRLHAMTFNLGIVVTQHMNARRVDAPKQQLLLSTLNLFDA